LLFFLFFRYLVKFDTPKRFMKHFTLLILLSLILVYSVNAQKKKIDSLLNILPKQKEDTGKVSILLDLALRNLYVDSYKTLDYAQKAYQLSLKLKSDVHIARSLNRLGGGYRVRGELGLALNSYKECLVLAEKIDDQQLQSRVLGNIAIAYADSDNYQIALTYYKKGLVLAQKIKDYKSVATKHNNIASAFRKLGQLDSATYYYQKAIPMYKKYNPDDISNCYFGLASIYYVQKKVDEALKYLDLVYESSTKYDNNKDLANYYRLMANIKFDQDSLKIAVEYAKKTVGYAEQNKSKETLASGYEILSKILEKQGDDKNALKYKNLFVLYKDSIRSQESKNALLLYENDQKELQKQLAKDEKRIQELINYGLTIVIGFMFILAYFLYRGQQKEKSAKKTLDYAYRELNIKNKNLKDSIIYAQRIQEAILPVPELFNNTFKDDGYFILLKPRDIVSGDFYFLHEQHNKIIVSAIDCTGHGVPGAFMSMIADQLLYEIIVEKQIFEPDLILNHLHLEIRRALKQEEYNNRDGMDMSLLLIDKENKKVAFAGAKNPLIYFQNQQFHEIKANPRPIGGEQAEKERIFTKHMIDVSVPTTLYMFSDGYQDQFGGPRGKKFMYAQFKSLLSEIHLNQMPVQKTMLNEALEQWRLTSNQEQIDDVLVMGIRV